MILSSDSKRYTSLYLAVTNGHITTVKTLLKFFYIKNVAIETTIKIDVCTTLAKLTNIALRSNFTEITKLLLITYNCDVNY
jgi:hypothetical protein